MFDNADWNKIINTILLYVGEDWKYLIVKSVFSKTSYSTKFYYSIDGDSFVDLYNEIDDDAISPLVDDMMAELEKISEKFDNDEEKMLLTVKVEKSGNVKVIYRDVKEGDKLPSDDSHNYLRLSDNDKEL